MKYFVFLILFLCIPIQINAQKTISVEDVDQLISKGIDYLYNRDFTNSLETFAKAEKISEENKYYEQQFISVNCTGLNYYEMTDYSVALDYYLKAYSIAIKNLKTDQEMTVLNNIALVYMKQGKYRESEKHQKRAYDLAITNNKPIAIAKYCSSLADLYNIMGQWDKASSYIHIGRNTLMAEPDPRTEVDIDLAEAKNSIARKEYDKALRLLEPLRVKIGNKKTYNDQNINALLMLSKIYYEKKDREKALSFASIAKNENVNFANNIEIYDHFSYLNLRFGNFEDAVAYKDSVIAVKDSMNAVKNQAMYHNSEIKIQLQDSEKKLTSEKKLKQYIIGFSVMLIGLLTSIFISFYFRHKHKKTIAERNEKIVMLELKNVEKDKLLIEERSREQETAALLEKEKIKNELESRNRTLAVNAIETVQRNEKVEQFITKLKNTPELINNMQLSRKLDQLILIFNKEEGRDDFLTHFEEINSDFIKNLKTLHPSLTSNDIRFMSYIYMNLSLKEISSIFNITVEATRKRKKRISEKINLESSTDLYDYLSRL